MKAMYKPLLVLMLATSMLAQTAPPAGTTSTTTTTTKKARRMRKTASSNAPVTSRDIQELKEMLQQQQQQINALQQQMQQRDQQLQLTQQELQQAQQSAAEAQSKAATAQTAADQQKQSIADVQGQMADVKTTLTSTATEIQETQKKVSGPATDSIVLKQGKIKIGGVAFADWAMYPQTGFAPAFLDLPNMYPGPGNDKYNAFDVTRAYVNIFYNPTDWLTFRVTPDIYRNVGTPAAAKLGATSGISSTPNGSLDFRLKYGYAEFHNIFGDGAFKEDNIRAGQQTNALVDWEEGLYDYRFTSLIPWNFISLSSTYTGVSINGPIKSSNGKQYLDYQLGIFNNSNFHAFELAETKTVMGRLSVYPFGATSKYQGLGLTGFFDYGYNNVAPDAQNETPVVRAAALAHFQSTKGGAQIAFEYDYGRNAFSLGNLFGGSAPLDTLGLAPPVVTPFADMSKLAAAIVAGKHVRQQGYDVFGHINIPNTKWGFFGLFQHFQPNTNVPDDPLDFNRVVGGISYRVNRNLRFAFDSQDVLYTNSQFTYPNATLATWNPALAASFPGGVANAVPPSVKALFLNMEFTF